MKKLYISVVIPSFNEEHNIRTGTLGSVYDYLKDRKYSWEIIVVDDGSTDNTVLLAQKFADRHKEVSVMRESHRGKAGSVIAGMLKARGEIILFTDMDQATPIDQLKKILPKFEQGYDVVIGSRQGREGAPFIRKAMAYGYAFLRNLILQLPYKDTQCGFKAFKKSASDKIFRKLKIFKDNQETSGASVSAGFDLEILYIAKKLNLKVTEVPVIWHHKEGTRVNPIVDSWEGFRDLVKVRLNSWKY